MLNIVDIPLFPYRTDGSPKIINNKPVPCVMFTGCDPKIVPELAKVSFVKGIF